MGKKFICSLLPPIWGGLERELQGVHYSLPSGEGWGGAN